MVKEKILDNIIEIAKEEIDDLEKIETQDVERFKKRIDHLLDLLIEDDLRF